MHTPKQAPDMPHIATHATASPRAGRLHWGGVAFALLVLAMPGTALTQPAGDTSAPGASYTTVANDSVWRLAGLALGSSRGDRAQAMAAILRLNPDAFMQGNLHRLKRGVTITLPSPAKFGERAVYTGYQGDTGSAAAVTSESRGRISFATTAPLEPRQGLTVAVAFPPGVVDAPTSATKTGWFLALLADR